MSDIAFDVTVPQAALVPLIHRAASCASAKSPQELLRCAVLTARDGSLFIKSTDSVVLGFEARTDAVVREAGAVAVDAQALLTTVNNLPRGDIKLRAKDGKLFLSHGKTLFQLGALSPDDYSPLPDPTSATLLLEMPASELATVLARGSYASDTSGVRIALEASLFDVAGGALRVISTDGGRMAIALTETGGPLNPTTIALPTKCVAELRKLCDLVKDGTVTISATHADLFARAGELTLFCKTSDATMLKAWKVFRANADKTRRHVVTASTDAILAAVRRVSAVIGPHVAVRLDFTPGLCRVSATTGTNDGADECACDAVAEFGLFCKPGQLIDALSMVQNDVVRLELGSERDPLLVTGAGSSEVEAIVMPLIPAAA